MYLSGSINSRTFKLCMRRVCGTRSVSMYFNFVDAFNLSFRKKNNRNASFT